MNKRETHVVQGMSRDLAVHRFNPNMVVDARNIRITTLKENSTLLSVTNEKGTARLSVSGTDILGTVIGSAVLNSTLVLFTTESQDHIYRLDFASDFNSAVCTSLFNGPLGFDTSHPLETLPVYETETIQKVYWVDGKNQPRMINICNGFQSNPDAFNFNRKIDGGYHMHIVKSNTGGEFPVGTVQYCFNYFNKFGQETNIVDQSPLYYLCPRETGLPADAMSTCSFTINLSGLDNHYEYVRLYSIVRTSENATPNVRIVGDYRIQSTNNVHDVVRVLSYWDDLSLFRSAKDNWYVYDVSTQSMQKVTSLYPNEEDDVHFNIVLSPSQYLYNAATNKVFFSYFLNTETGIIAESKYELLEVYYEDTYLYIPLTDAVMSGVLAEAVIQDIVVNDNGIIGSTIDATSLFFIGGQDIIANTMTSKDNTLFLGGIKGNVPNAGTVRIGAASNVKTMARGTAAPCSFNYSGTRIISFIPDYNDKLYAAGEGFYSDYIDNNRSSYDIKGFKARENYRLGFIAQYNTGQWSEAIWIGDVDETATPGRNVFYNTHNGVKWGAHYRKPGFTATLSISIVNALRGAGFIRVAPVVVYPQDSERKVMFQGILSTSAFNVNDRYDNSPFAQNDWRFREGYTWNNILGEIQCNPFGYANTLPKATWADGSSTSTIHLATSDFVSKFPTEYYRDPSILTFHSPDVEAMEDLYQADFEGMKMRIVGVSNAGFNSEGHAVIPTSVIDTFLTIKSQGFDPDRSTILDYSSGAPSYARKDVNGNSIVTNRYVEGNTDLSYAGFLDVKVKESDIENHEGEIVQDTNTLYKWVTYLWHRNGSLNNQGALSTNALKYGSIRYALLDKKCISEIKYARTTFFQTANTIGPSEVDVEINTPRLFNSDQVGIEKFSAGADDGLFYYGNIDKVLTCNFQDLSSVDIESSISGRTKAYDLSSGYPIYSMGYLSGSRDTDYYSGGRRGGYLGDRSHAQRDATGQGDLASGKGKDPVSMKYKSTKHLVIGLKSSSSRTIVQLGSVPSPAFKPFWKDESCSFVNALAGELDDTVGSYDGFYNGVFVAELYRDFTESQLASRFGGTSDEAISNNVWTRCGVSVELQTGVPVLLEYKEGDTYVGRYDCLKAYPFTNEDQNQIVSIYSTELESRVNLDARYDKNRGLSSNLYIRPNNFNLFNHPGYEQSNQFFTYKGIDYDRYKSMNYPNMLTWTLEKKMGADIDAWTSVHLTSTHDMQGDLGEITKLAAFNDNIFAFQNRGVAQILFNSRVQVPTSDGQPIEITNGLKFSGARYLSNQIGLTNKWSLKETPYAIYFVDDEKNTLYQFNGQQFQDLSSKQGFRTWISSINSYKVWNPVGYENIRTFYDKSNQDVYFITKDDALVYSEQLGVFTSFMDYGGIPDLVNVNDRVLTFTTNSTTHKVATWKLFEGDFNMFFGEFKPYWLTFVSNTDPTIDKTYDNLAWRTFDYSNVTSDFEGTLEPMRTFDTLRVWNDHQDTGDVALFDTQNKPSSLKKKFNVFRALVPRDREGIWTGKGLNRIRNTWSYIQLARKMPNTDLLMFSDLDVDFFE